MEWNQYQDEMPCLLTPEHRQVMIDICNKIAAYFSGFTGTAEATVSIYMGRVFLRVRLRTPYAPIVVAEYSIHGSALPNRKNKAELMSFSNELSHGMSIELNRIINKVKGVA